jgi:hypothetical protein
MSSQEKKQSADSLGKHEKKIETGTGEAMLALRFACDI